MTTVPVQTRLSHDLASVIDARAKKAKVTRAEFVRGLVEAALAPQPAEAPEPSQPQQPAEVAPAIDPLLDRIIDELAAIAVRVDAALAASRSAERHALGAHAASRLHALTVLPQHQQAAFVEKIAKAVQP